MKVNVRQIEARADAHKGQVLVFDEAGNAAPGKIEEKHVDQPTRRKIAYSQILENWDMDIGAQVLLETIGDYNVLTFLSTDDTAIYKDIDLGNAYDPDKPLFIRYQYSMDAASTDEVFIDIGYEFVGDDFDTAVAMTTVEDHFNPVADVYFHTRKLQLPAQPTLGVFPKLTLQFARLATTDTNSDDFRLFSVMIYQEAN